MGRRKGRGEPPKPRGEFRIRGVHDPFAVERIDDRLDYDEERFVIIGMAAGQILLFVVYTERGSQIRLISARRATKHEEDDYYRQNSSVDER